MQETQKFIPLKDEKITAQSILLEVFNALEEKGYDPVHQMVGFLMSGDPTYITSYNNARSTIVKLERDELLEELLKGYIKNNE